MASLTIRKTTSLPMTGGSSVKSASKLTNVALLMSFSGKAEVALNVKPVNVKVNEPVSLVLNETGYVVISINQCIGTTIQIHGPPMVDITPYFPSFTVFTVYSVITHLIQSIMNFLNYTCSCGYSAYRR